MSLRNQRQGALLELGSLASQHPAAKMWTLLDQASEALILDLDELRRLPNVDWQGWGLQGDYATGVTFVQGVAQRLLASRWMVLNRMDETMASTERQWSAILG